MPKLKQGTIVPTQEEDEAINRGIAADVDTCELSATDVKQMKKMGRPKAEVTKERITIRLSPDVLERFRATGAGWQTKVDAALRDWLKTHIPH
ncbi:hypothetical protein D3C72_2056840 [compost metagenome]